MKRCSNYSAGLRIYCADRKKVIQVCKNPIAEGNFEWIFACNCEGTEQLQDVNNSFSPVRLYSKRVMRFM